MEKFVPPDISQEAIDYACSQRRSLKAKSHHHLFMGVAWMIPHECERFKKYPEVIHVDGTESTNKEKCTLMTVVTKERSGKMVTIMRAFLPNQQDWAFKWLFYNVFPIFFSPYLLSRVRVIIRW